jgi:hypothetical protein
MAKYLALLALLALAVGSAAANDDALLKAQHHSELLAAKVCLCARGAWC